MRRASIVAACMRSLRARPRRLRREAQRDRVQAGQVPGQARHPALGQARQFKGDKVAWEKAIKSAKRRAERISARHTRGQTYRNYRRSAMVRNRDMRSTARLAIRIACSCSLAHARLRAAQQGARRRTAGRRSSTAQRAAGRSARQYPAAQQRAVLARRPQRRDINPYQTTQVRGIETNVLVQTQGEIWRQIRNGPITVYGGRLLIFVIAGASWPSTCGRGRSRSTGR